MSVHQDQTILACYIKAINQIEDYFEYRYESDTDKRFVMQAIDEMTAEISKRAQEEN